MTLKICLAVIITLLLVLIIASIFVGNFFYNLAINPNSSKKMIFSNDGLSHHELTPEEEWLEKSSKFEEVFATSFDDLKLHGYQVLNKDTHKWAVTVHGYMADAFSLSTKAFHYYNEGYNVLAMDLRGHGKSKGNYIGMGYHDAKDLIKWLEYIISKDKEAEILIHGVSMGAATVMIASSLDNLPQNVKVIIEDCGYTTALEQFKYQLKKLFNIELLMLGGGGVLNWSFIQAGLCDEVSLVVAASADGSTKTPTLFMEKEGLSKDKPVHFKLQDVKIMDGDSLWLRYTVKK